MLRAKAIPLEDSRNRAAGTPRKARRAPAHQARLGEFARDAGGPPQILPTPSLRGLDCDKVSRPPGCLRAYDGFFSLAIWVCSNSCAHRDCSTCSCGELDRAGCSEVNSSPTRHGAMRSSNLLMLRVSPAADDKVRPSERGARRLHQRPRRASDGSPLDPGHRPDEPGASRYRPSPCLC